MRLRSPGKTSENTRGGEIGGGGGKTKAAAESQSEAPTSCGKNGHGAIMFLLGFISKRVINYTSKYNDDDEGYYDYYILLHTAHVDMCIHTRVYVYVYMHDNIQHRRCNPNPSAFLSFPQQSETS